MKRAALILFALLKACAQTFVNPWQVKFDATFASPPTPPFANVLYLFHDASSTGVCSGGGSSYAICVWNGVAFVSVGAAFTGLGDPGSNSIPFRNGVGTTVPASATQIMGPEHCVAGGSTNAYTCTLSPAIASYSGGTLYWFQANAANTGAATVNFNSLGALTIKKMQGGITTDLAAN